MKVILMFGHFWQSSCIQIVDIGLRVYLLVTPHDDTKTKTYIFCKYFKTITEKNLLFQAVTLAREAGSEVNVQTLKRY